MARFSKLPKHTVQPCDTPGVYTKEVQEFFYSVLGNAAITPGYNWGGGDDKTKAEAAAYGLMKSGKPGIYEKTFYNLTTGNDTQYEFKVAANGTFDSGLSWGSKDGGNIVFSLSDLGGKVTSTNVTISFNSETHEIIDVTDNNGVLQLLGEDQEINWYVTGELMDNTIYANSYTYVYDTVRDITRSFRFSSGANSPRQNMLAWSYGEEMNATQKFIPESGYSLDYSVDGKSVTGNFKSKIINLEVRSVKEESSNNILPQTYVEEFFPGKQWIKVFSYGSTPTKTSGGAYEKWTTAYHDYEEYLSKQNQYNNLSYVYYDYFGGAEYAESINGVVTRANLLDYLKDYPDMEQQCMEARGVNSLTKIKGELDKMVADGKNEEPTLTADTLSAEESICSTRNIRLIPTAYLESGTDASVSVFKKIDGTPVDRNSVTYEDSTSECSFTSNEAGISQQGFSYYNFALTAGYLITDKVGLGIYNNYSKQSVAQYDVDNVRNDNEIASAKSGTYFAMSAAYNNSTDDNVKAVSMYSDGGSSEGANLSLDKLVDECVIGKTHIDNTITDMNTKKEVNAKTIVKITKENVSVNNGKASVTYANVNVDGDFTNSDGIHFTPAQKNYLKWTGQQKFDSKDAGRYKVTFYWMLGDGRYLEDSKYVDIYEVIAGLSKYVNKNAINVDDGNNKEIKYTLIYTNDLNIGDVDFALLDVLPYGGDSRKSDVKNTEPEWSVKNIDIKTSDSSVKVSDIYYSTDPKVREKYGQENYKDSGDKNAVDGSLANEIITRDDNENIVLNNEASGLFSKYTNGSTVNNVTGLLISGNMGGVTSTVKVEITLSLNASTNDKYYNNACYYVHHGDLASTGISNTVETVVVSRSLSGYAWYDANRNSVYDGGESSAQNIKVNLYKKDGNNYVLVKGKGTDGKDYCLTNELGYYKFSSLPPGTYAVGFGENPDEKVAISSLGVYDFDDLDLSQNKSYSNNTSKCNYNRNREYKNFVDGKSVPVKSKSFAKSTPIGSTSKYSIIGISLPTDAQIYNTRKGISGSGIINGINGNQHYNYYFPKDDSNRYNYNKIVQNISLYDKQDLPYKYSLDVNKYSDGGRENGTPLQGVEFELYCKVDVSMFGDLADCTDDELKEYIAGTNVTLAKFKEAIAYFKDYEEYYMPVYQIPYTAGQISSNSSLNGKTHMYYTIDLTEYLDWAKHSADTMTTNTEGHISVEGLVLGDYKLSETKTAEGYYVYPSPYEFSLPYKYSSDELLNLNNPETCYQQTDKDYVEVQLLPDKANLVPYSVIGDEPLYTNENGNAPFEYTFKSVTLNITNEKSYNFKLPQTGGNDWNLVWLLVPVGAILLAVSIRLLYKSKARKNTAS